jgi:hypothetical protein
MILPTDTPLAALRVARPALADVPIGTSRKARIFETRHCRSACSQRHLKA